MSRRDPVARWENRLLRAAHPVAFPLVRLVGRAGPQVRVPGVGTVVSDPVAARSILLDTDDYRKDGPGSSGALWTPILGPTVLLNMEGEGHRQLRRKLVPLFTRVNAESMCARVLTPLVDEAVKRLASGEAVDLVPLTRAAAGAVIGEILGLPPGGTAQDLELFERGEQITSMVTLRTKEFSPRQVARAKEVLGELVEAAGRAYDDGSPDTVAGRMRELGLSRAEALGAAAAFLLTGTETIATTVPRLFAIWQDSGLLDPGAARAGGAVTETNLDAAIDEAMRVMSPSPAMLRRKTDSGARYLIATLNCTRSYGPFDPAVARGERPAPDPQRLWFGAGPHYCVGAPLALAEIRTLTRGLLAAGPLRVAARRVSRSVLIPAYAKLELARTGSARLPDDRMLEDASC
ncbi:MAG TPA: cytochrome P450 [Actinocrinis sp.]|nr:cytochrome P450 [Actinocrinis sp.]